MHQGIQGNFIPLIEQRLKDENQPFHQRIADGYVNATQLCKACSKEFKHYNELKTTKAFVQELSSDVGITTSELIQIVRGGIPDLQGTWVHPQVAINLGQWLAPKFAVAVSKWIFDWMSGKSNSKLPYHLRRYLANQNKIPHTHFSMLNEMVIALIAPLENQGYQLPEKLVPDISEGRMFCSWLRKQGIEPKNFPTYPHIYEDGRVVNAKLYPNKILHKFRDHFHTVWMPQKSVEYFKKRDTVAVPHIQQILISSNEYTDILPEEE